MSAFPVSIEYLEVEGQRARLMHPVERRRWEEMAAGEGRSAAAAAAFLEADASARKAGDVQTMEFRFRMPSYRDRLGIQASGRAAAREWADANGAELTPDLVAAFVVEEQGRVLCEGEWGDVPEEWRADVAGIVAQAVTLSEDERRPLFGG